MTARSTPWRIRYASSLELCVRTTTAMLRIALARQLENAPRLEAVGRGDDEQSRVLDAREIEHAVRRIASP